MTGLDLTHRRAERFAVSVDAALGGGTPSRGAEGLDVELLALVGAMRSVPRVEPRPEFAADLRGRLMTLAETELVPATGTEQARPAAPERRVRRPRERRFAVAVAAVAIVGASSSMAVASQSALPGDTLYPLKRAIEDAHAHLSIGDKAEGTTLLHSAGDRLDEARDLSQADDADADRVTGSLDAFASQLSQGADLLMRDYRQRGDGASIDVLRTFDAASMITLRQLEGTVPEQSEPALRAAAERLFTIDAAAGQLCPSCSTAGISSIPPTLLSSDTGTVTPSTAPTVVPTTPPSVTTHRPHASASAAPSHRPSTRPSGTASASIAPTSLPSSTPSSRPSTRATPSDIVSSILGSATSRPTHKASGLPSVSLPTVAPSVLPSLSSVASAVATSVSGLLGGLG